MLIGMRLYSWNVNGLRSVYKNNHWKWFETAKPDVLCLQEIKSLPDQLPPDVSNPKGYHVSFNTPLILKGYSGVATYSKALPQSVKYNGLPEEFGTEGRLIETHFERFILFNVYFPNAGRGEERLRYKLAYYDAFLAHIETLRKEGQSIVVCGDFNVAHEEIDLARPKANEDKTGFLPEERAWVDELLNLGYIDTFRYLHPDSIDAYSYWDTLTRARDRNVGWRIDYFFISPDLLPYLKKAEIHTEVYGSDHCPVSVELIF